VTSLAVLVAAFGSAVNLPILDPIVGLIIGIAILGIAWQAIKKVFYRMMDAVDPSIVNRIEHFTETVEGVESIESLRVRWVGHRLFTELCVTVDELRTLVEGHSVAQNIRRSLFDAIPVMGEVVVSIQPTFTSTEAKKALSSRVNAEMASILPPRYQNQVPSAAPMGAAGLKYDDGGGVAWNEIWTDFCDLALAGGPPHRGTLLEPADPTAVAQNLPAYEKVLAELERGIRMVTGLDVVRSSAPGWIGMVCDSEEMALWLLRAIIVENVSVRREDKTLFFPAGPDFRVEKEIKNVITVIAKTTHYWQEHITAGNAP
jgi:hypothetical protein